MYLAHLESACQWLQHHSVTININFNMKGSIMALKPGPKPIAKTTGEVDKRRRDNKDTPGNNPDLKPSKSSKK